MYAAFAHDPTYIPPRALATCPLTHGRSNLLEGKELSYDDLVGKVPAGPRAVRTLEVDLTAVRRKDHLTERVSDALSAEVLYRGSDVLQGDVLAQ